MHADRVRGLLAGAPCEAGVVGCRPKAFSCGPHRQAHNVDPHWAQHGVLPAAALHANAVDFYGSLALANVDPKLFAGLVTIRPSACGMAFNKALRDHRACSCPACSQLTREGARMLTKSLPASPIGWIRENRSAINLLLK